jgi:formate hydrogenlyase subunit 6/NADH:ubiquinone oxidoreductase subunit I
VDVPVLVECLAKEAKLIGPRAKDGRTVFDVIVDPADLTLEYPTSILPPGRHLFPDGEVLLRYKRGEIEATRGVVESEPLILLGVHPCDVHGINVLDEVFSDAPEDANYLARRAQTRIIAVECQTPCGPYSICYDKGTSRVEWGHDVLLVDIGDRYFVFTRTRAGEAMLKTVSCLDLSTPADREALDRAREVQASTFKNRLTARVNRLPSALREAYDDLLWEAIGRRCLSCETCTMVCPTCFCFDVQDEVSLDLTNGHRCRLWDSCQNRSFAVVAGGENFRGKAAARQRHRVFKKEVYQHEKYGRSGCVGCGRCSAQCVASIRLTEIYNQVLGG